LTMPIDYGQKILFLISNAGKIITFPRIRDCYLYSRKKLLPRPTDLSYYNWETQLSTSNSSPHYQVIADSAQGLLFKNKRDRKVINVNPALSPGDNTTRLELPSDEYVQIVIYDHTTRRRI